MLGNNITRSKNKGSEQHTSNEPYITIDYTMSASQVYQQLTKYMFNKYRVLDVLCVLNIYPCLGLEMPTWAPEWREHPGRSLHPTEHWDYLSQDFAATGGTLAESQDPLAKGGARSLILGTTSNHNPKSQM